MRASNVGGRRLTDHDFIRLKKFNAAHAAPQLGSILDAAMVVSARVMPGDVITMYSRCVVRDLKMQRRQILTLCYPADAAPGKGFISVLSSAGLGLIGLPVGELARWAGAGGHETVAQIEAVLFQPEASGDYTT